MKKLLAVLLLAVPCLAQSGTITIPASLTNNEMNISALLPPLDAGNTRWRFNVVSTFEQTVRVTHNYPGPVLVDTRFCDTAQITSGALVLAEGSNRTRITMVCDAGVTEASRTTFLSYGATVSANHQDLVGPFILRNTVRSAVSREYPTFGRGQIIKQTISQSSTILEYEGRP